MDTILRVVFLPQDQNNNNPYQNQLAQHLLELNVQVEGGKSGAFFLGSALMQWKPDILHLHWLHSYFVKSSLLKTVVSAVIFLSELIILRVLGVKIVWTVHNLKNHNNRYLKLEKFCTAAVARIAHAIIAHCEAAKDEVVTAFALEHREKVFVVPHGHYIGCYENTLSQAEARQNLGISDSKIVLLFFGLIRPYKGVFELIDVFNQLRADDTQLIITGKIWNDSLEQAEILEQKVNSNENIKFIPGFVADDQIQLYMNASDIVVFPYRDILTSGAVMLAMSFGRACIAPRMGCIAEVLDDMGSFLYDSSQVDGISQSIELAIQKRAELARMSEHNRQLAEQYDWDRIAEKTLRVYQTCLS